MRITEVFAKCPICKWQGQVIDCELDVDGDGNLGCPKCEAIVDTREDISFDSN